MPCCAECFTDQERFESAFAVACAQGDLFGAPLQPRPVEEIAREIESIMHKVAITEGL